MGASIAWQLARRLDPHTDPVVLLEKKELAAGSSGKSGAILRQFYGDREVAAMARDSLRVFRSFENTTGRSIAFMHSGVLTLGSRAKPGEAERVAAIVAMMRTIGIEVELIDASRLRVLVPGIVASDDTVAAWEPDAGAVDPVLTVQAFAALAREHGAVTRIGACAEELVVERGRLRGVRTQDGVIECERAVVAAGPWTRPIFERIGVELPLRVVRPEQHFLALPGGALGAPGPTSTSRTLAALTQPREEELFARFDGDGNGLGRAPHPVLLDLEHGLYSRCDLVTRRTRVGRLDYDTDADVPDPDRVDERVSAEFQAWARATLSMRLPRYAQEPDADSFVGMYTLTPDAQAVLGPVEGRDGPIEGLFVASGFSGHGFKLAPSIGEGLAQMVLGEPVSAFDPAFFAPSRFRAAAVRRSGAFGL
ncbi:MAG: FAD-binding oxidoreductase [Planctomycetes bacterium]|nr:FAD-binding oxidoreductase [Planctomycetota bacterium]